MNWIYKNNTDKIILYRNNTWQPNDEISISYPVPSTLGLTCIQEGSSPDPVLFHDDFIISAGEQEIINLASPLLSHNVALTILCMTTNSGVECRFNSSNNKPIPIDARGFQQVIAWEMCSKIFLLNPTDNQVHISVSAIEVIN